MSTIVPSLHVGTRSASGLLLALVEPKDMVKVVETVWLSRDRLSLFADIVTDTQYLQ